MEQSKDQATIGDSSIKRASDEEIERYKKFETVKNRIMHIFKEAELSVGAMKSILQTLKWEIYNTAKL